MNGALLVDRFSIEKKIIAMVLGVIALTGSAYLEIPMYPVPMTMQTAVVLLIGALYGRVLGASTVGTWLGLAALGAPVLAGGNGGILYMTGPTGGYLIGFFAAAYLVGYLSDRGWNGMKPHLAFAAMIMGGVIILGLGFAWLSTLFGIEKAWILGVAPFIYGDIIKSILAVLVLVGVHKTFTEKFL